MDEPNAGQTPKDLESRPPRESDLVGFSRERDQRGAPTMPTSSCRAGPGTDKEPCIAVQTKNAMVNNLGE